jgi:hypothetical protein
MYSWIYRDQLRFQKKKTYSGFTLWTVGLIQEVPGGFLTKLPPKGYPAIWTVGSDPSGGMKKEGLLPSRREVGDDGWRAHASAARDDGLRPSAEGGGSARWPVGQPRKRASGPPDRAEGEGGAVPSWACRSVGREAGWLGQRAKTREERKK